MYALKNCYKVESSANGMTNFSAVVAILLFLITMAIMMITRNVFSYSQ